MANNNVQELQNDWTKDMTLNLQQYAFQAIGNSYMTGDDAKYFNAQFTKTSYAKNILIAISTIGIAGLIYFVQNRTERWSVVLFWICSIAALLLNVTIGLIIAYQTTQNFPSNIITSSINAIKFGSLARQIKNEFYKPLDKRQDAMILLGYVTDRFNELEQEKPFIREESVKEWQNYSANYKDDPSMISQIIMLPEEYRYTPKVMKTKDFTMKTTNVNYEAIDNKTNELINNDTNDHEIIEIPKEHTHTHTSLLENESTDKNQKNKVSNFVNYFI